ncbi:ABC-F family ATP-binding cassette domain-containing protein [Vibrio sp. LaRot3]|uniref:ABC-F family ATP-binding cassette domain-containing protein n=1 Tax=Vibrio sp. LaRot3 TaxID=2998829 RepID=UPI0022CDD19B|nr:ABC-F family ATP-binding cassette domain-containing protein [Vibrio sp. LaRot3]MDA0149791.1 ABC-F family ATP-binding cassette domain-containing protein [Vibrio sp. LaRot3]
MSTLLSAQSIDFNTPSKTLFEALSFTLKQGDRIGLVGHNGCGKSTLLQLLFGSKEPHAGDITLSSHCLMEQVEQHLPEKLVNLSMLEAVTAKLPKEEQIPEQWRAERILSDMGFTPADWLLTSSALSGGQHTRLLLARALISQPDLLLLDEPSNHLDLPTLLWLERFLLNWKGSFVLVSHDRRLLNRVTNCTWILRDKTLSYFQLPCSQALNELQRVDEAAKQRNLAEQKEIDRIEKSAKRLANWGRIYDNEDLARKAKNMERRVERLKETKTELTAGTPWQLRLNGECLKADRLVACSDLAVRPTPEAPKLVQVVAQQLKSGDRVAIVGSNGSGKSSMLKMLWQSYNDKAMNNHSIQFHPLCRLGFYDQSLKQLDDDATLIEALECFTDLNEERRKIALISAGFEYGRQSQRVHELSGGERSRLLMLGLSLAEYHLLMLDEPTNHLDIEGKDELSDALNQFEGGVLLVSHDRELIERSCNRFWLISNGELTEWHDLEKLYLEIDSLPEQSVAKQSLALADANIPQPLSEIESEEVILERLYQLEALIEEDLLRKPKCQKPKMQEKWRQEIEQIAAQLNLQ